jgi:hypothetical protein
MEHRHHVRVPLALDMLIYRRGMPVATGRIRDASRGGVFIQTDYCELREYQNLEFEFQSRVLANGERQRVAGHVLRCEADGIALEIDDRDHAAVVAMGSLLGARVAPERAAEALEMMN